MSKYVIMVLCLIIVCLWYACTFAGLQGLQYVPSQNCIYINVDYQHYKSYNRLYNIINRFDNKHDYQIDCN